MKISKKFEAQAFQPKNLISDRIERSLWVSLSNEKFGFSRLHRLSI